MTGPSDTTKYPPPEPERVERALHAMRARRSKLRRVRIVAVSGAVAAAAVVAVVVVAYSPTGTSRLRVESGSSTTTSLASSTTTATTGAEQGSQVVTYLPFTAAGAVAPDLRVTAHVTGTCVTGESRRSYRCFAASPSGAVYDPCFVGPHGTTGPLVCPLDPATGEVVELTATSVTSQPPPTSTRPWAMQLSGGEVCRFVAAAWGGLGPYDCRRDSSTAAPADCRQPQPARPWWTADCQDRKTDGSPFTPRRVIAVWF